jgi:hypothetical protein
MDRDISSVVAWLDRIYLGGIPQLISDETAFLSFVCMLTGIEALAGYWKPELSGQGSNGERFRGFVKEYFVDAYHEQADNLWSFRNGMIHGFAPRCFALTHHNSRTHFRKTSDGALVLNAEDFYAAFLAAASKYFSDLETRPVLQQSFRARLADRDGGAIAVGFVDLLAPEVQPDRS